MKNKGLKIIFVLVLLAIALSPLPSLAQNQAPTYTKSEAEVQQEAISRFTDNFECWGGITGGFNVAACTALFTYYVLFVPTSFILAITGKLFDLLLFFTIDSASYSGVYSQFITEGWRILRDLVNIAFILILLSLGIKIILDLKAAEAKKMIGAVVIIALLINFSLFFVRVIVDAGNVLAHVFYNATVATTDPNYLGSKSISTTLVNAYNPSRIFQAFHRQNQLSVTLDRGDPNAPIVDLVKREGAKTGATNSNQYAGFFILFALLGTILNVVTIWIFLMVCLLFLARTVGLWLVMIFAPIAFISYIVPKVEGFKTGFGHRDWWMDLLKYTLLAPIFVFFLYLVAMFLNLGAIKDILSAETSSTLQKVLAIMFPFFVVIAILLRAKKTAVELAGKLGETIMAAAQKVVGVAGGAVLGVAGFAGRAVIGRGAEAALGGRAAAGAMVEEEAIRRRRLAELGVTGAAAERMAPTGLKPGETSPYGKKEEQVVTPPTEAKAPVEETPEERAVGRYEKIITAKEEQKKKNEAAVAAGTMGYQASQRENKAIDTDIKEAQAKVTELKALPKKKKEEVEEEKAPPRGKTIKDRAAEGGVRGWLAQKGVKMLAGAYTRSWDPRATWGSKQIEKYFGLNFGKPKGKGGFKAAQDARIKSELEFAKLLEPSPVELFHLRRIGNTLNDMKIGMKRYNAKDLFEHDDKGKMKKDAEGNKITRAGADMNLVNSYNNLESQIAKWQKSYDTEKKNMDDITATRLNKYARVAGSGKGMNFVINMATMGKFGSAQGQEAAHRIREAIGKGGVRVEDSVDAIMRELKEFKKEKEQKAKEKPAPKPKEEKKEGV